MATTPTSPDERRGATAVNSARVAFGIRSGSSGRYHEVGNITGITTNTQQATQNTTETLNHMIRTRVGQPGATTATINVLYSATGPANRLLHANVGSGSDLQAEIIVPETNQSVIGSFTIATGGLLTGSTLGDLSLDTIQEGRVIYLASASAGSTAILGEVAYIDTDSDGDISEVGLTDADGNAAAVLSTAASLCIADPGLRLRFPFSVASAGDLNITPGQDATSTLNLSLTSGLPAPRVVVGLSELTTS